MKSAKRESPGLLLAIDAGNTNIVLGIFKGAQLVADWRLATRRDQTADEYGVLVRGLLSPSGIDMAEIKGAVLASVVPPLTTMLAEFVRRSIGSSPLVVEPGVRTGMPILYEPPQDVGADRIVNAVAAFERFGGPVVVVDFGTATTFDVVTRKGEYAGGVICPGIGIGADALFERAARLPRVEVRHPGSIIARSTVSSIQAGLYFGYVAMVEGLLARIESELGESPRVVATGGMAEILARETRTIEAVDPTLTLTGLRIVWERNQGLVGHDDR
jgi:type III pantothenate kinase